MISSSQFPLPGFSKVTDTPLGQDGSIRREFTAVIPSDSKYYFVAIDVLPLSQRSSAASWVQQEDCAWRSTDPNNTPTASGSDSAALVGDGARACYYSFNDGSRLFTFTTGTRNIGLFIQTSPVSGASDEDALNLITSLAALQLEIIDQASPSGVTSTALTYTGTKALLDGASFPTASYSSRPVTFNGTDGKPVTVMGFPGLIGLWIPAGESSYASDVQTIVEYFGGKVIGQVPTIGLYSVQVDAGKEGEFIDNMRTLGAEASPTLAISTETENVDASVPHAVEIQAPQVQLDDFKTPLCVKNCNDTPDKRTYLTLPVAPGFPYGTTSDPSQALTHGALVQYLRLGRVPDTQEPTLSMDIANPVGLTETVGVFQDWNSIYTNLRLVLGAADGTLTTTVNLSLGPSCNGAAGCSSQAANEEFLSKLEEMVNISNAQDKAVLVVSAGNDGSNVSMPPSVTNDPAWSSIIRVGALYPNGTELNPVSNYSIDNDILYVPVNHVMLGATGTEECYLCMGTSFAAPQIDYLVGEIARNRPDLTPAQLKQILFDAEVSPVRTVDGPNGLRLQVHAIQDPYDPATLDAALRVAQRLFPLQEPQLPGQQNQQQQNQQGNQFTPMGQRNFNLPLQFAGTARLPDAQAGEYKDYWFCKDPPASPAFFCGVNATNDPIGGHPPYHFQLGPLGGFPPFGLILNTNGHLAGTINPAAARSTPYKFTICVYDLDGKSVCQPTSLLVTAAPTPTPTRTPTPTPTPVATATPLPTQMPTVGSVTSLTCTIGSSRTDFQPSNNRTVTYMTWNVKASGAATGPENARVLINQNPWWTTWNLNSGSWSATDGVSTGGPNRTPGVSRQTGQPETTNWTLSGTYNPTTAYSSDKPFPGETFANHFTITVTTGWGGSAQATCQ